MLEKIRNQVAKDSAFDDWDDLCFCHGEMESIKRFEELTKFCDEVSQRYAQSQTQELTAWKESASKVFKNLDLQAIGKTLGIGLGEDVSVNVLPKIKELQEQNAELVVMLERAKLEFKQFRDAFGQGSLLINEIDKLILKHNKQ